MSTSQSSPLSPLGWFGRGITASSTADLNGGTGTNINGARFLVPVAAQLVAISWEMSAAITTGTLTLEVWLDGSITAQTLALVTASGARGIWTLATPLAIPAGSGLHFKYTATAGTFGASVIVNPIVRFT